MAGGGQQTAGSKGGNSVIAGNPAVQAGGAPIVGGAETAVPVGGMSVPTDPYGQSAAAYRGALGAAAGSPYAADIMGMYANPYQQDVIDNTTNNMMRNNAIMQSQNGMNAANAGAFGGSRHGVVEAITNAETNRNIGDMTGQLSQQGFNTAAGLANQDINNRYGQAQLLSGLSGQGFGYGQQLTQDQLAMGNQQQQLLQAILSGGANEFQNFMNSPYQALDTLRSGMSGNPLGGNISGNVNASSNPGFGGALSLIGQGAGMLLGGPAGAAAGGAGKGGKGG